MSPWHLNGLQCLYLVMEAKYRLKRVLCLSTFIAFNICLLISCRSDSESRVKADNSAIQKRLDSAALKFMNDGDVMGASVAVLSPTDTIFNKTYGYLDLDRSIPATNNHRFIIASISKLIGATVVMKLVEEKKLNLDHTLSELLPDFPNQQMASKVTLRQMISHTSGLPEYSKVIDTAYAHSGVEPTSMDIQNFFNEQELIFEPDSHYSYCNSGFRLMADIVERVTGRSYQSEIDRIINKAAGTDLKLIRETAKGPEMSPYFEIAGGNPKATEHWLWIKGDGGLTATAIDLAHFPFYWSDGTLIGDQAYNEMITGRQLNNGIQTGYGLGVRNGEIAGHKMIGHTGGHNTPLSVMAYFPEDDLTIVTFVNTDKSANHVRKLFAAVCHSYFNKPVPYYNKSMKDPEASKAIKGAYVSGDGQEIQIKYDTLNNSLSYCISQDQCETLYRIAENRYWIKRWPYDYLEFSFGTDSTVLGLKEYYYGYYFDLKKKIDKE